MAHDLTGKKVAFLTANDGVEQVELTQPWEAVRAAGGEPVLLAPEEGEVQGRNHLEKADTFPVDATVASANVDDYAGLVLPGGVANPDKLRMEDDAVSFVKAFVDAGKPVAAICHGPWMLVEADVVRNRTVTSYPSVRTDIVNAGGEWVDEEVQVDNGVVTSRKPDDLDAFCAKLVEEICEGPHDPPVDPEAEGIVDQQAAVLARSSPDGSSP